MGSSRHRISPTGQAAGWILLTSLALVGFAIAGDPQTQAGSSLVSPRSVVINEVAWGGTAYSHYDEWIELYNNTASPLDLSGWSLTDSDDVYVDLDGVIPAHGYYLLERSHDDCSVSDIPADQTYTNSLDNDGERLELYAGDGALVDTAGVDGPWPAGSGSPGYHSMERISSRAPNDPANWSSNSGLVRNGLDCGNEPINGTPKARNSVSYADLSLSKHGPTTIPPGAPITYTITVSNVGQLPAPATLLTDRLPDAVEFVTQSAQYPFERPQPDMLVWDLGTLATDTAAAPITFTITGQVYGTAYGTLINEITATAGTLDGKPANNRAFVVTTVTQPGTPTVLIESVYAHTYGGMQDEAFRLINASPVPVYLSGWTFTDGEGVAAFPPDTVLPEGQRLWCTRSANAFAAAFGILPGFEWAGDHPAVPDMEYSGSLALNNDGEAVMLYNASGELEDVLVYGNGVAPEEGWTGPALQPYNPTQSFPQEGQVLSRKRDQGSGLPVADSDSAVDWAQDPADAINGCRVAYPGWDLDAFFFTRRVTETASVTVAVGPDNLYGTIAPLLAGARESIQVQSYSFRSRELADVLLDRLDGGVNVTLLLEGAPAFEGVSDEEAWIAGQLAARGAQVLFMINDDASGVHDRYRYQHAKVIIIDGDLVLIGSENLNPGSMPADDKENGTAGRRGVYLATDAPGVVARVQAILDADADPANHTDVVSCGQVPALCTPPSGFEPPYTADWVTYTVQFPSALEVQGTFSFEVLSAPESSLRDQDGLLGLLAQAGEGDTVLVEMFYADAHWGPVDGTPESNPNPRLEAYLSAARRGARVRILLDGHFDAEGENQRTIAYLGQAARSEGLDLQARPANPTFLGLHNKMVLAHIAGQGYAHVGSINGNEASSKVNREVALQVQSDAVYRYLEEVFDYDWSTTRLFVYAPLAANRYEEPRAADHLLISEVYYRTVPEKEWVEVHNPTGEAFDLSLFKLGDASNRDDPEGMLQFPAGTVLGPRQTLVIAATATGFRDEFPGISPDIEMVDSDPAVPNMREYAGWGTWDWGLHNDGDEVLLLGPDDIAVDVVVWGAGTFAGVLPHPGVIAYSHSLERSPPWLDTDDCSHDFRDWPYPDPGEVP